VGASWRREAAVTPDRAELVEQVRALRRAGLTYSAIAAELGVSYNRAWRLADPANAEAARRSSRRWKERQRRSEAGGAS
jgi:orotate phosphoribosyltransferase-like protein